MQPLRSLCVPQLVSRLIATPCRPVSSIGVNQESVDRAVVGLLRQRTRLQQGLEPSLYSLDFGNHPERIGVLEQQHGRIARRGKLGVLAQTVYNQVEIA
jgi:hypothetical protein